MGVCVRSVGSVRALIRVQWVSVCVLQVQFALSPGPVGFCVRSVGSVHALIRVQWVSVCVLEVQFEL